MRGFTLVELILVIFIIGILATLTTIEVFWWMRESRLTEYRDRLLADLENIKLKSMTSYPQGIICQNNQYEVVALKDMRCRSDNNIACVPETSQDDCGDENICTVTGNFIRDPGEPTFRLQYADNPFNLRRNYLLNCPSELWLDRMGYPRTSNWGVNGVTFRVYYDKNNNLQFDEGELVREITISTIGRIRYE